jgi:hypothetical protein
MPFLNLTGAWSAWRARMSWVDLALFALFGLVLPAVVATLVARNLQLGIQVATYLVAALTLWWAFKSVTPVAPWPVKVIMTVALGQFILNIGFSNMVVGMGSAKVTLAEMGMLLALVFLLPATFSMLRTFSYFWVALLAILVPLVTHLYSDFFTYKLAAFRDFLSVVDIIYFLGGMAVCACGLMRGEWTAWRNKFIGTWMIATAAYALTWPFSGLLTEISPKFQSYQQSVAVVGFHLTTPINVMAAALALFALPEVFPSNKVIRKLLTIMIVVGAGVMLAMIQSRNLYIIAILLPGMLVLFGYHKAFTGTLVTVAALVFSLGMLEAYEVRIPGRISDITLTAVADRLLSISGKHGDQAGASGVKQRQGWWASTLHKWSASPETIVLGVGYGMPLTNFMAPAVDGGEAVVVREPHNSFLSSLARGGIVYFCLWGYIVMGSWYVAFRAAMDRDKWGNAGPLRGFGIWAFLLMFTVLVQSLSEPLFENPSPAAIYYVVAGMVVVEYAHAQRERQSRAAAFLREGRPA